jgi:hypothetical protein|tara:strand:- start:1611 stop:2117 length:507 start_codon:yes stop_codon:yes gene_type:complete
MTKKMSIPETYIPKSLTAKDKAQQCKNLRKSRRLYKQMRYYKRPKVKSFKNKKSVHLTNAKRIYGIEKLEIAKELSDKTQCTIEGLEQIVNKGRGAYYSSGSRPNQTADSWGIARLASAITGGKASIVDYHILNEHCKPKSKAIKLANKTCRKEKKCKKYLNKTKRKN